MVAPAGYLLCGTPRTGSTLLCSLLGSTGVLGRPASYFREPDEAAWAARLGVPVVDGRAGDYRHFVASVRAAATTPNGVFGARVMWGSLGRVMRGLAQRSGQSDRGVLEESLGPLAFVFLRREDVVAQAVSWCRAEQTGFWQEGDAAASLPRQDVQQSKDLLRVIGDHEEAWRSWFDRHGVAPHTLTYEEVVREPRRTVEGLAALLGVRVPATWRPTSSSTRQADDLSHAWGAALRAALSDEHP